MATTIDQQVALDKALVPSTKRLRIGRSNFRLPSDIQSKESTLQVVYDVLRRCPFFQAFFVTADKLWSFLGLSDIVMKYDILQMDDNILSTIKVVSRHQDTQQYGAILSLTPPIATPTPITTAAPVPRLSAAAKDKRPARATTHTEPTDIERTEAEQLKIVLRRSRQETYISQQRGFGTDEGTGKATKKKQGKRKSKVLIQFQELLKEVRMKAMIRRIKT
nr:hypothetical protein [Tanacetum cinerariifolium]